MGVSRRVAGWTGGVALFAALTAAWPALAGPPWANDNNSFPTSFLRESDLPMPAGGNESLQAGCTGSAARYGCTFEGKKLWLARDPNHAVGQVHDIRWVFPDAASAQRYLAESSRELSENMKPVSQPPAVGSDSQLWSATNSMFGMNVFMYNLVFRVDNVVVKLFLAQGGGDAKVLTPLMIGALGQKAADRIRSAESSSAPPVAAPPVAANPPPSEPTPIAAPEPTPPAPAPPDPPAPAQAPAPTPEPEPARPRGRLAEEVREYWRRGVRDPYFFIGGDYSRSLGTYKLAGGLPLREKNAFDISLGALVHPRVYFQVMFHREVWQVPAVEELLVRRLEFIYGLDLLALPPTWRVRPALLGLVGFGLGFGRVDSLAGSGMTDPLNPVPAPTVTEGRALGVGGIVGGEFAIHFRVAKKFELAPFAGITVPAYTYTKDFPAGDRRIDGERGFGRAPRWHVGLKIGFGGRG
ncbi:MAG: hypothetical protein JNL82_15985 [Myxococcales bacterium]|nr:hypothetical protein [Myxococcales bacterium]